MSTEQNLKVTVKGGRYVGKKWFLKIPYKVIETDVEFSEQGITFNQGSAAAIVKNKFKTEIAYNSITSVSVARKFSMPNIILAICAILGAVLCAVPALLIVAAVVLFIGSTAVAQIDYSGSTYEVPTEFKSEAEELQSKINTAISQSRM